MAGVQERMRQRFPQAVLHVLWPAHQIHLWWCENPLQGFRGFCCTPWEVWWSVFNTMYDYRSDCITSSSQAQRNDYYLLRNIAREIGLVRMYWWKHSYRDGVEIIDKGLDQFQEVNLVAILKAWRQYQIMDGASISNCISKHYYGQQRPIGNSSLFIQNGRVQPSAGTPGSEASYQGKNGSPSEHITEYSRNNLVTT